LALRLRERIRLETAPKPTVTTRREIGRAKMMEPMEEELGL
jgi:hypothetical protein